VYSLLLHGDERLHPDFSASILHMLKLNDAIGKCATEMQDATNKWIWSRGRRDAACFSFFRRRCRSNSRSAKNMSRLSFCWTRTAFFDILGILISKK
jgi:hypothetical protein